MVQLGKGTMIKGRRTCLQRRQAVVEGICAKSNKEYNFTDIHDVERYMGRNVGLLLFSQSCARARAVFKKNSPPPPPKIKEFEIFNFRYIASNLDLRITIENSLYIIIVTLT